MTGHSVSVIIRAYALEYLQDIHEAVDSIIKHTIIPYDIIVLETRENISQEMAEYKVEK